MCACAVFLSYEKGLVGAIPQGKTRRGWKGWVGEEGKKVRGVLFTFSLAGLCRFPTRQNNIFAFFGKRKWLFNLILLKGLNGFSLLRLHVRTANLTL